MPRPLGSTKTPTYRFHKASEQAVTTIDGQDFYLGPYGTQASKLEYDRIIGEWLAAGRQLPVKANQMAVLELINAYLKHCKTYYGDSGELDSIILALRVIKRLYGHTRVADFGPLALKAVREAMIGLGWSRKYINAQVGRLIRMFRWGVENEKVTSLVLEALRAVPGLRRGKTTARELPPVRPVSDEQVSAILPHVPKPVKGIIELMQLTGARAGEIVIMRGCDIDTSGDVWQFRPETHKTLHHGHERTIYIGPKAQDVVRTFLRLNPTEYLFRPDESVATHLQARSAARETYLSCGNRPGTNRRRNPKKKPGERYTVGSFRQAIDRACKIAFPLPGDLARQQVPGRKKDATRLETIKEWKARLGDRWVELKKWRGDHRFHPHQLRHSAATKFRKQYGLEAAQVLLGHATLTASQIYAEKDTEAATRVMAEVG